MKGSDATEAAALPPEALKIAEFLEQVESPLLTSHVRMDGDAIGSELGLFHTLTAMGKRPRVVNDGPVPKMFRFLPGVDRVVDIASGGCSLVGPVLVMDTPTWARTGRVAESVDPEATRLSIDHHLHVERVGEIEWNDPAKSSVGEMIFGLIVERDWPLTPEAATCLYVAIVTDTGRFTFSNTTGDAMRACARLMDAGADRRLVSNCLYQSQEFGLHRLRCAAGAGIALHLDGKVASMRLTREMFERYGVDPIDTQEFADIPRSIRGVEVGLTLREMDKPGQVKASLRSCGKVNVAEVARAFGGGGHVEAAGCELECSIAEAEERVLSALQERVR